MPPGSVFVVDRAIRRVDWLAEDLVYIGHFEAELFDKTLELRIQIIRWDSDDSFAPSPQMVRRLDATP